MSIEPEEDGATDDPISAPCPPCNVESFSTIDRGCAQCSAIVTHPRIDVPWTPIDAKRTSTRLWTSSRIVRTSVGSRPAGSSSS